MVQFEESKTWGSLIIGQLRSRADESSGASPTFAPRLSGFGFRLTSNGFFTKFTPLDILAGGSKISSFASPLCDREGHYCQAE